MTSFNKGHLPTHFLKFCWCKKILLVFVLVKSYFLSVLWWFNSLFTPSILSVGNKAVMLVVWFFPVANLIFLFVYTIIKFHCDILGVVVFLIISIILIFLNLKGYLFQQFGKWLTIMSLNSVSPLLQFWDMMTLKLT